MKIILVLTNARRKSAVFVTETLRTFSLSEMIDAVTDSAIEKLYAVTGTSGTYIRSAPDEKTKNNIDELSITGPQLIAIAQGHAQSTLAVHQYVALYLESSSGKDPYIMPVGNFRVPVIVVKRVFRSHRSTIREASQEFGIDQYLLGAIIIDEIARLAPFEPLLEKLYTNVIGKNTTIGVAQVSLETANDLIQDGLYNPNPKDKRLPFMGRLTNTDREYLYHYVVEPEHNIRFASAYIRDVANELNNRGTVGSNDRAIVATFYSKSLGEKAEIKASKRGKQIAGEFYEYAKEWFK